ncbi:calcium-dependent protein kinase 11-like, partial [Pimephales promelas]|uniref:calcium-dependent protein kinase 11-like n=1 Tax=Pimephales promelas TaxID=90988 RepID=UPI0019558E7C
INRISLKPSFVLSFPSLDQTSQLVPRTIEAEILSVAEEPGHAEVDDEWSEDAFQDLVGDSSEWSADVLNALSSVSILDVLQPTACATSDRVPVLDVATYRANVRRVPARHVADSSVDVPQVPVSTTSAPGLETADCCVDVPVCATSDWEDDGPPVPDCATSDWEDDGPPVPDCATSDWEDDGPPVPDCATSDWEDDGSPVPDCATSVWEDDGPHVAPTVDTVSENEIIYVGCWSYKVGRKLGEGGFGSVYAGTRLKDGLKVALKFADTEGIEWINIEDNPEPVPLEIGLQILANKGPRVPQIIQLLDWDEEPNRYIMVLEFPTPCESLIEYLDRHDYYIDENVAKVIMHQAAVAAQTCCQRGVLHRDIKLENLLISPETLDVKLIDFGCGEILTDAGYTSFAGTEEYCPPEYESYGFYHGKPATVWSLGVLMFTLVCGEFPSSEDLDMLNDNIWTEMAYHKNAANYFALSCKGTQRSGLIWMLSVSTSGLSTSNIDFMKKDLKTFYRKTCHPLFRIF